MPIDFNVKDNMLHKAPMLLVDAILEENDKTATTSFKIKEDCIFLNKNSVLARPVFVEIIAQSFAAVDTYQKQRDKKEKSKGFLVGVRDFKIYGDARSGDELICKLEKTDEVNGLNICKAFVLKNGQTTNLAEGELRIFEITE
jgi:predicted hotdog family 3-hydroxylacyl-ACP dehydratase